MKILHSESDKKKNSKNDLNKIETRFVKVGIENEWFRKEEWKNVKW